ncbi:MAG: DUF2156 domain-containing protein [Oscillospiraceae bacterium]
MIFHDITPEDGRWARPLLAANGYKSCEYAFVNVYMWNRVYHSKIARFEDFVVARSEGKRLHYLYPAGNGDVEKALEAILQDAQEAGKTPILFSLTEEAKATVEQLYPGRFHFEMPRGESDYIYLASDLAELPGKKFQKKRNHCSRFERGNPGWQFHEITPDSIAAIAAFNNEWCNLYDNREDEGIAEEHRAIELALRHYDELCLKGGYIAVDGRIVAFSFGSPLGSDMFVTHVEKALYDVAGAYNIINREMARRFCSGYTYINRENDVDEEGLREAKLSYQPVQIEHKYTAELITNE